MSLFGRRCCAGRFCRHVWLWLFCWCVCVAVPPGHRYCCHLLLRLVAAAGQRIAAVTSLLLASGARKILNDPSDDTALYFTYCYLPFPYFTLQVAQEILNDPNDDTALSLIYANVNGAPCCARCA